MRNPIKLYENLRTVVYVPFYMAIERGDWAAMGINVERYFVLAWMLAGFVALLGGLVWGNAIGVDTQLAALGLKVFPVVILGGLDSILGVIIGGIVVGVAEAISAGYVDP